MKCIQWIRKRNGPIPSRLGLMKVRMKHHLRAMPRCPADRLRIPPALMADHHSERQLTHLKHPPLRPLPISALFRRIDLHLILKPRHAPVRIDHQRGSQQSASHKSLGPQYNGHPSLPRGGSHAIPGPTQESSVRRRHALAGSSISRHKTLREANNRGPLHGRSFNRSNRRHH